MRLRLLCIGRNARDPLLDAAQKYQQRIGKFASIQVLRLKEGQLQSECQQIESKLQPKDYIIALDEHGQALRTTELATNLQGFADNGIADIVFLIGGANGLHPNLKKRARQLWALSALTLPHRLAQVVLLEQIYRAFSINHGLPYHRP